MFTFFLSAEYFCQTFEATLSQKSCSVRVIHSFFFIKYQTTMTFIDISTLQIDEIDILRAFMHLLLTQILKIDVVLIIYSNLQDVTDDESDFILDCHVHE